ncbi:amidase [Pandoraea terrigena]|uniref:Acylamidase n=1 Tax=Pandoraea terrigena TaxID=2508292 RepID=A0A5E4X4C6_9BURK|nr:amidase [Pandoraea terrigena]VVE31211.1 Acylamidase [Pandoraea terrigena]
MAAAPARPAQPAQPLQAADSRAAAGTIATHARPVNDIVALDALALSDAIRARRVSCREVMQAYLAHIAQYNPAVNAIVSLRDGDDLLAQADERDRQLAGGVSLGWMHGMPHAVKDFAACAGFPTRKGSPLTSAAPDTQDSISVARIRAAGAIFIGKTNVSEFGLGSHSYNPVFGTTRNAYDPTRSAGGSSGGAGSALALRMLPVADGSDMMGSLRNPAAFGNVYGFRPSQGRVPYGPAPELFVQQLSTEGPMGRTVADVAQLLATQAGYDARSPLSLAQDHGAVPFLSALQRDVKGLRLGWLGDYGGHLPMEDGVMALCEASLRDFTAIGCEVEACAPDFAPARLWQTWLTLRHWLVSGSLGELYADPARRDKLKPEAQWEVEGGRALRAADVYRASVDRSEWYRSLARLFERYDFLLLPSAQVFPFDAQWHWPSSVAGKPMDTYHRWMEVVIGPTLAGLPAISVPVGFDARGLPMGLQIIGPAQADLAVLQLAHAYERQTQWVRRHLPPMLTNTARR